MPEVEEPPLADGEAEALRRYWREGREGWADRPVGLLEEVLRRRERVVAAMSLAKARPRQPNGLARGEG